MKEYLIIFSDDSGEELIRSRVRGKRALDAILGRGHELACSVAIYVKEHIYNNYELEDGYTL